MRFIEVSAILSALLLPFSANATCNNGNGSGYVLQGDLALSREQGLIWKRCAIGMRWSDAEKTCVGEPQGFSLEEAVDYARNEGNGWRVPTGQELETLLIDTCDGPNIDMVAFPNLAASDFGEGAKFWTSTEAIPGMRYFFDFTHGYVDMHSSGFRLSVLLVKGSLRSK
ncbi:DUF1566 domain-containing protein [Cohaesibacter haloalkalitolerans]|uniref:Lcl C-terminal domain-containing protein n=1 Tax=Cohaesibacter haloalkalitolerans TaxID=1162980 RepID=UPI000E6563B0|nr:DUF1566 domain-containing protein [Cohaesibacter haloalkalitolerans]